MKIGILGGSFNPIHSGHLKISSYVQEKLKLDRVIFIPSAHPPHKQEKEMAKAKERERMTRLAIKDNPCFSVSDIELKKKGKSYTIQTIRQLRGIYPGSHFYFIIGADTLKELLTWKNYKGLLRSCRFIMVNRPGYNLEDIRDKELKKIKEMIHYIPVPGIDVSSTEIRKRIAQGKSIKYLVPPAVEAYIHKKGVYR